MSKKLVLIIVILLLIGTLLVMAKVPKAKATTQSFHLYGEAEVGWGFTPSSITSPGPEIPVGQDDLVNLTLTSQDGLPHIFFVDYNGNGGADPNEPQSAQFTGTINFQFIANTSGTFTYYCSIHPSKMHGTFSVTAIPEFQPFLVMPILMMVTLLAVLIYRRRAPKQP
jgi:plastocyanin